MARRRRPTLDLLVFAGLLLVELLVRSMPPAVAVRLADLAGDLWYRIDPRRRARAAESLRVAREGGLAVADPQALIRASFRQFMRIPFESILFGRLFPRPQAILRRCRFLGDWRRFDRENRSGRPGIVAAGHLGSWEVAAVGLRWVPRPVQVVVRPIANPWLDRRVVAARGGRERLLTKRGAVPAMLARLRGGGWVGLLADQDAGLRGTFLPFFGLDASTYAAPAVLAVRTGAALYVGAALRDDARGPFHYEMHLIRIPDPPPGTPEPEAVERLLRGYLGALEALVRRRPEQFNWVHRRWKSRPAGEVPSPRQPAYARRPDPGTGPAPVPRT